MRGFKCVFACMHVNCINSQYPGSNIHRFSLTREQIPWSFPFPDYNPPKFTSPYILSNKPEWADVENTENIKFNTLDESTNLNRKSHQGIFKITEDNIPINPIGRTGLAGRGKLGRWGPNHAADPIVTRWKRGPCNDVIIDSCTGLPILQFVAITRRDCGQWALPGGMVDAGEHVSSTLRREFCEEAVNLENGAALIKEAFQTGEEIYSGYVDDPRNTDNSWIETTAMNFHADSYDDPISQLSLHHGDDAVGVQWMDITPGINVYANHALFINHVALKKGALKCN